MEYPKTNTTYFFKTRNDVVGFVEDVMYSFGQDYPWTMTTTLVKSEGYSVHFVIGTSSEDTVNRKAWPYLEQLQLI